MASTENPIRSLVNARDLHLECASFLHVLMYGFETMIWKERSRIRVVQMDNLKGLLGIKRMDKSKMHGYGR